MAVEGKRGCGYRKVGGLYLVSGGVGVPCGRFPIPCEVCPCCSAGIKQARGWTWVDAPKLLAGTTCSKAEPSATRPSLCQICPFGDLATSGRAGLLWIGESFYPTPEHFLLEANSMGVSRRIKAVPKGFELGKTWVMFGHPKGYDREDGTKGAALVYAFRPTKLEMLVTESQAADQEAMEALAKRNITPVVVPDDDKDHQGTVYDKEDKAGSELDLGDE